MCKSLAFKTLSKCLASPDVKRGDVRVYAEGTKPPGIYVPLADDSARSMHLEQIKQHFERNKAAG